MKDFDNYTKDELLNYIKELQKQLNDDKYGIYWDKHIEQEKHVSYAIKNIPFMQMEKELNIINGKDNNILIEADNYDFLVSLKMCNRRLFDCIYIDPPYNTGNKDFIYNDCFVDKEDGYRHSKWLSFMNSRLIIARELLTKNGVLFISIDEHEVGNLKLLCDKIFGYDNVDILIWQKTDPKVDRNTNSKVIKRFNNFHEYIFICYRNKKETTFNKIKKLPEWKQKQTNPDKDPRGNWQSGIISYEEGHKNEDVTSKNYYEITTPSGKKIKRHWFIDEEEMKILINDNRIYFPKNGDGVPRLKTFENEEKEYYMTSILTGFGTSSSAKDELYNIFKDREIFDTPKPTKLIKELIRAATTKDSNVLDFFAGSGTTGQAVLELNKEDGGHRRFILCTNNENNICTNVTYPRNKTVITGVRPDGTKYSDGISANLYYFRTDFIEDQANTEQARYNLVEKVDSLLCIAEDIMEEVERNDYSSHFINGTKHLFIYNDYYNEVKFNEFKQRVLAAQGEKIVYVYASDNNIDKTLIEGNDIDLKPIPSKIYEIYKEIVEEIKRGE